MTFERNKTVMLYYKNSTVESHLKLTLNHLKEGSSLSNLTIFASGSVARDSQEDSLQGDCLPKPCKGNHFIHHQTPKKKKQNLD